MSIDIVDLFETNPITKLNGNYQSKLIEKVKNTFTESQQQMFVASFYCYLNYHPTNDFVVDLDNVWRWLDFNQKIRAKELLEKNFIINKDYKKSLLSLQGKQTFAPECSGAKKHTIHILCLFSLQFQFGNPFEERKSYLMMFLPWLHSTIF
jgi:hypothetical protein